jgi:hypothetical protein
VKQISALMAALMAIPMYYIGKILYDRRAGVLAAFFIVFDFQSEVIEFLRVAKRLRAEARVNLALRQLAQRANALQGFGGRAGSGSGSLENARLGRLLHAFRPFGTAWRLRRTRGRAGQCECAKDTREKANHALHLRIDA